MNKEKLLAKKAELEAELNKGVTNSQNIRREIENFQGRLQENEVTCLRIQGAVKVLDDLLKEDETAIDGQ